ncbi:hypothetical protein GGR52DRAFT_528126 [Hypoxylon sp. FL1284]|nr:hypothetical protein GGR52DRAFT_528126 [Hypoxylon sp. FL1284]
MLFSCKDLFHGHQLDFVLESEGNLSVRAETFAEHQIFEFVPSSVLANSLPMMFLRHFVHWYNLEDDYLEFCACRAPWNHSSQNWRLLRTQSSWQLVKGNAVLVDMNSPTGTILADILSPLEIREWMQMVFHGSVGIELPRLELQFDLKSGDMMIISRQFRGMAVDEDQSIGTLVGLRDKLVLRQHGDQTRRKVIIPNGKTGFDKGDRHTTVTVDKNSAAKTYVYEVDTLLGRLTDDGSLQSKLLVSYLHALTSFVLPDPLTHQTGTEQALTILKSSAVRSFKRLTKEDHELLKDIALPTPKMEYYQSRQQVMQSVW